MPLISLSNQLHLEDQIWLYKPLNLDRNGYNRCSNWWVWSSPGSSPFWVITSNSHMAEDVPIRPHEVLSNRHGIVCSEFNCHVHRGQFRSELGHLGKGDLSPLDHVILLSRKMGLQGVLKSPYHIYHGPDPNWVFMPLGIKLQALMSLTTFINRHVSTIRIS